MSNPFAFPAAVEMSDVKVHTTSNRGHNADELSEMCLDRLIYVGKDTDPVLRDQALAYRGKIKQLLIHTIGQAQRSERTTLCVMLEEAGFHDAAAFIRRL